jgi:hypothetical protein
METSKKRRKWILFTLVALTICCFLPALPFAYDLIIYPKWVNVISPHHQLVRFSDPRLIAEDLLDAYNLTWSEDGSRIEVYEGHWTTATPDEPAIVKVFNAHTGALVDTYEEGERPEPENYVCSNENIMIALRDIDEENWLLSLVNKDKQTELTFSSVYRDEFGGSRKPYDASFSPECNYFTFTIDGWIYYEGEGPTELWLLDIQNAILRPIVIGRWPAVRLWDYPVQSVRPGWAPDEDEIVFGDSEFGLEIYNIATMKRRWLAGPGSAGFGPKWSHNGKWIASHQFGVNRTADSDSILVISLDGKKKAVTGQCSFSSDIEWSPVDNSLAYLCNNSHGNDSLWIWTIE